METSRGRRKSCHEEELSSESLQSGNDTPIYDPNFTFDYDNEENSEDVIDIDDVERNPNEDLPRGRSRSKSIHELDDMKTKGLSDVEIMAQKAKIKQYAEQRNDTLEKSGPLNNKEILALRKGLEEACTSKTIDKREEQAELEAALREKEQRSLSTYAAPQIGVDPPMKRVKILLLGDSAVGKTSILTRLTSSDNFHSKRVSTVGIDYKHIKVSIDGNPIQCQVWDTAGSEKFHKITATYYGSSDGIMLIYDISNKQTLTNISYWMSNIKAKCHENLQILLIGNKVDLRDLPEYDCATYAEGKAVAAKYNVPYAETSAFTENNIQESFLSLVRSIVVGDVNIVRKMSGIASSWGRKSNSSERRSPSHGSQLSSSPHEEEGREKDKCKIS